MISFFFFLSLFFLLSFLYSRAHCSRSFAHLLCVICCFLMLLKVSSNKLTFNSMHTITTSYTKITHEQEFEDRKINNTNANVWYEKCETGSDRNEQSSWNPDERKTMRFLQIYNCVHVIYSRVCISFPFCMWLQCMGSSKSSKITYLQFLNANSISSLFSLIMCLAIDYHHIISVVKRFFCCCC